MGLKETFSQICGSAGRVPGVRKRKSGLGPFTGFHTWHCDECKTHLCFEFISHAILCILYPYSCKTHKISSKLGFVGLLMKIKLFGKK